MSARRLEEPLEATRRAVLEGPAALDASVRAQLAANDPPGDLAALVRKIHHEAYRVTDADVDALRGRYSEDQIFEIIVAATLGAAEYRLRRAMAVLEDV